MQLFQLTQKRDAISRGVMARIERAWAALRTDDGSRRAEAPRREVSRCCAVRGRETAEPPPSLRAGHRRQRSGLQQHRGGRLKREERSESPGCVHLVLNFAATPQTAHLRCAPDVRARCSRHWLDESRSKRLSVPEGNISSYRTLRRGSPKDRAFSSAEAGLVRYAPRTGFCCPWSDI